MILWRFVWVLCWVILTAACDNKELIEYEMLQECQSHYQATSYRVALTRCEVAAQNDIVEAQWLLGHIHQYNLSGDGAQSELAFKWYLKAAENGLSIAQTLVGESYLYANGVKKDYVKAYNWLIKAAKSGDTNAEFSLGYVYFTGMGKEKDISSAIAWFKKSAAKQHQMSINNLTWIYATSAHKAFRHIHKAQYWANQLKVTKANKAIFLDTKAAVHALAGEFASAIELQNEAIASLAKNIDENQLLEYQQHLKAYENNLAWLE